MVDAVWDEGSERLAGEARSKVAISVIILEMVVGEEVGDEKGGGDLGDLGDGSGRFLKIGAARGVVQECWHLGHSVHMIYWTMVFQPAFHVADHLWCILWQSFPLPLVLTMTRITRPPFLQLEHPIRILLDALSRDAHFAMVFPDTYHPSHMLHSLQKPRCYTE